MMDLRHVPSGRTFVQNVRMEQDKAVVPVELSNVLPGYAQEFPAIYLIFCQQMWKCYFGYGSVRAKKIIPHVLFEPILRMLYLEEGFGIHS